MKAVAAIFLSMVTAVAVANDFPTQARVEYVLLCMKQEGGQTIQNLYACSCAADKLAGMIQYDKYVEAETLAAMINTPGEKGGPFRDVPGARKLLGSIQEMKNSALNACKIRPVSGTTQ